MSYDDLSLRVGLTRKVYEGLKSVMSAGGSPLSEEARPPQSLDLLTTLEEMLGAYDVDEVTAVPMILLDAENKLGTPGFCFAGLDERGFLVRDCFYFLEPGDPPAVRKLPRSKHLPAVDPEDLGGIETVNRRMLSQLRTSARELIDLVQSRVAPDVPIELAPTEVWDDSEVLAAVDNFNQVACAASVLMRQRVLFTDEFVDRYRRREMETGSGGFVVGRD